MSYAYHADVQSLARETDCLVVTCPLTPETRGLIDAPALDALGANGFLVNVARGPVVVEGAVLDALRNNVDAATQPISGFANRPENHHQKIRTARNGMVLKKGATTKGMSPMPSKKDVHTVKDGGGKGWVNKVAGESVSAHRTQKKAIEKGRTIAKQAESEHLIHGTDGQIRARNTYGKDPIPPQR